MSMKQETFLDRKIDLNSRWIRFDPGFIPTSVSKFRLSLQHQLMRTRSKPLWRR